MAQRVKNPDTVLVRMKVQSLAFLSGLRIQRCHELWWRLAAAAPMHPLAWELPYAMDVALKRCTKRVGTRRGVQVFHYGV